MAVSRASMAWQHMLTPSLLPVCNILPPPPSSLLLVCGSGAFFLLVMIFTFSNISVLELFLDDRALYLVEKSAGYYR